MTNNELTHQPEKIGLEFLHSKGKKNQNSFQIPENHKGRKEGRKKKKNSKIQQTKTRDTTSEPNSKQTRGQTKEKKEKREKKLVL
jgi:hypothetical protein